MKATDDYYIKQYEMLHKANADYGKTSQNKLAILNRLIVELNAKDILDYGCGKSRLAVDAAQTHNIKSTLYDPAIDEYKQKPKKNFDLLICTDVLEHIPEHHISNLLAELSSYSDKAFLTISTRKATHYLPDGQNAHVTVESPDFWIAHISKFYDSLFTLYNKQRKVLYVLTWKPTNLNKFYLYYHVKLSMQIKNILSKLRQVLKF